ncbi:MAG: CopG family transcriptional regulator [Bacillota bacterium]
MPEITEKITINLSVVDLGKVDFLVEQGFYANRTDFVKGAIRRTLDSHEGAVQRALEARQNAIGETLSRTSTTVGLLFLGRSDLEAARRKGQRLDLNIIGLLSFGADVTPELADEAITTLRVYGSLRASPEVKRVLKGKMPLQAN